MRPLRARHLDPFLRSVDLTEKSAREPRDQKRKIHHVSDSAKPDTDDRLDSWKEIASHLKRTVRTVQRWEKQEGLPVHRHLHLRANSVYACKSELDEWWSHEANFVEAKPLDSSEVPWREVAHPQVSTVSTMSRSEAGYLEGNPTPPQYFVECLLEGCGTCSSEDTTGRAVLLVPCMALRGSSGWDSGKTPKHLAFVTVSGGHLFKSGIAARPLSALVLDGKAGPKYNALGVDDFRGNLAESRFLSPATLESSARFGRRIQVQKTQSRGLRP